ncbi:MAG: helix-turn-helix domain-containing protein [Acidobacteria bacterium]|nr:helix-turn-helix domain-containing protein [Acidobacteriota bacterium]
MSVRLIDLVLSRYPGGSGKKLALVVLADFANDAGECWPSVETVAAKTGQTKRNAQYVLAELRREGMLELISGGKGGAGHTNRLRLNANALRSLPELRVKSLRPLRVKKTTAKGEMFDTERVKASAKTEPVSINEPSLEPPRNRQSAAVAGEEIEEFNRERGFQEFHRAYAKREKGHAAQVAYCEALVDLHKTRRLGAKEAHALLLAKAGRYCSLVPARFQARMAEWLARGVYEQDEASWRDDRRSPAPERPAARGKYDGMTGMERAMAQRAGVLHAG